MGVVDENVGVGLDPGLFGKARGFRLETACRGKAGGLAQRREVVLTERRDVRVDIVPHRGIEAFAAERSDVRIEGVVAEAGRGGRGRRGLGEAFLGLFQPLIDTFARVFQKPRRAFLGKPDAFGKLGRGAFLAVLQPLGDAADLFADIVHGLGRAALGIGDAFGQPLGDAGDLAAQLFQRLGADLVAALQPRLHRMAHARDLAAHLFDGIGGAVFDLLHPTAEGVGHA